MSNSFTQVPKLYTSHLLLRGFSSSDTTNLFKLYSNTQVVTYLNIQAYTESREAEIYIDSLHDEQMRGASLRWVITKKPNDNLIGTVGFQQINKTHARAEVTYDLMPLYWNQHYMTESLSVVLSYGFESMGLNRIEALVAPKNVHSSALLISSGFKQEGLLRDYEFFRGDYNSLFLYSKLRKEHMSIE